MGSGGSAMAMIQSLKANKLLLGKRYSIYDAKKDYSIAAKGLKINTKKATPEQIRQIKELIRKQKRIGRIKTIIALCLIFPFFIFGVYQFRSVFSETESYEQVELNKRNDRDYHYYMEDGDYMLSKKEWNNAIFQYTRASEIFPNKYTVQYKLAMAYTYKCKQTNEACGTSDSLVSRLLIQFPNKEEVKELRVFLDTKD